MGFTSTFIAHCSLAYHTIRSDDIMTSSEVDGLIYRRAKDAVQAEDALIGQAATSIARALNLEGNNSTLGAKFVRNAIDSSTLEEFKEKALQYGRSDECSLVIFRFIFRSS